MDLIKKCEQLKAELEVAQKTAIELQKAMKTANLDVVNLGLAFHVVGLRLDYLNKQSAARKKNKTEVPAEKPAEEKAAESAEAKPEETSEAKPAATSE